jgi:hypothetical protein
MRIFMSSTLLAVFGRLAHLGGSVTIPMWADAWPMAAEAGFPGRLLG